VLADEVVFQKRMAILQSILLLACMALVIFSRGMAGSGYGGDWALHNGNREPWVSPTTRSFSTGLGGFSNSPSPFKHSGDGAATSGGSPLRRGQTLDEHGHSRTFSRTHSYTDKMLPLTPTSVEDETDAAAVPELRVEFGASIANDAMSTYTAPAVIGLGEELSRETSPEELSADQDEPGAQSTDDRERFAELEVESDAFSTESERKPLPALPEDPT
jgi:hypothetical protein